ncbi:MAG: mechanosensitive ion channel family protein [Oscillospiraceae bacterium]|jgi:small conductance mechanosensitive channel|nr:mechanosensitive ion channel family protein [Oscillospiraceae bacterium]
MKEQTFFDVVIGYYSANAWLRRLIYCAVVLLAALLISVIVRAVIRSYIGKRGGRNLRADTVAKLLGSVVSVIVWFLAAIQILTVGFGMDVTSIIAAAGVLGVAVGFGAQTMVKDVITGFFILFENQFSVGEQVTVDAFNGTVEELGLRSTKIRGENGDLLIIPNGSITRVVNHSRV